jgi:hypothetical protein
MNEVYKSLGLIAITITWISLGFLVYYWRGDNSMTFSKHAAAHKKAYLTMALVESLVFPLYFIFIYKWFTPTFHLTPIFILLNGLGSAGLLIAGWVPDKGGLSSKIHKATAYPAYFLFIPVMAIMINSSRVGAFARSLGLAALVYMLAAGCYLILVSKSKRHILPIQAAFLASLHISILAAVYIR